MKRIIIGNGNYQNDDTIVIPLEGNVDTLMAQIKAAINAGPDKLIVDLATARKKKKYHVVMQSIEYYGIDVEAYDEYEAMELAENTDGGEFIFEDNTPWEINEVKEVEE